VSEKILVTSALPYANGSVHLGHLVEYIQTDVYVRFRRACGDEVHYICAADSHGTPIEVNAQKAGQAPEAFVEAFRKEQHADFKRFDVDFSIYHSTHSPENQRWANRIYEALRGKGLIEKRPLEQLYCETDKRFLPDRFVKGTCPKCGTADQYGDACEKCGSTYEPRDLKDPSCVICRSRPVLRTSEHYYVTLRPLAEKLRDWVNGTENGRSHLDPSVREQVLAWLDDLQDWCVSRDAPYFGFPVPGDPTKFLYVWLDAPIGYISSTEALLGADRTEGIWKAGASDWKIEHFIGKDITRFHAVFWPAMLMAAGLKTPARVNVHGHLTVNGEKMSKSRGTFVTARTYLDSGLDPQLLRWFYAANLGSAPSDLDLALDEFKNRVNADLANNVANLAARTGKLLGAEAVSADADPALRQATVSALARARTAYESVELREAIRAITELANHCNKRLQDEKPWQAPQSPGARRLLYSIAKALEGIAVAAAPVLPRFGAGLFAALGKPAPRWVHGLDPFDGSPVSSRASAGSRRRRWRSSSPPAARRPRSLNCPRCRPRRRSERSRRPHPCRLGSRATTTSPGWSSGWAWSPPPSASRGRTSSSSCRWTSVSRRLAPSPPASPRPTRPRTWSASASWSSPTSSLASSARSPRRGCCSPPESRRTSRWSRSRTPSLPGRR
jgi:methionyl-tRNA synthetase